jgi:hypothetical protein
MSEFTVETFKAAYPELHAQIDSAAYQRGLAEGESKGRSEGMVSGAEAERKRIQDVEAQLLPGHEALIAQLKGDGKTTGAEAAVQVINADRVLRETKLKSFQEDKTAKAVAQVDPGNGSGDKAITAASKEEAGDKIDAMARELQAKEGLGYKAAYERVIKENKALADTYLGR